MSFRKEAAKIYALSKLGNGFLNRITVKKKLN
jgi:hypothetical protein